MQAPHVSTAQQAASRPAAAHSSTNRPIDTSGYCECTHQAHVLLLATDCITQHSHTLLAYGCAQQHYWLACGMDGHDGACQREQESHMKAFCLCTQDSMFCSGGSGSCVRFIRHVLMCLTDMLSRQRIVAQLYRLLALQ
jgi:hypothetical protein